jgi:hypothetical protein
MTEAEWLACDDPEAMLNWVGPSASERKLRLFMCACCHRVWPLIMEPHCCGAVEVAELYAEGEADANDLAIACEEANLYWADGEAEGDMNAREATTYPVDPDAFESADSCASCARSAGHYSDSAEDVSWRRTERAAQAELIRCIFRGPCGTTRGLSPALLCWDEGIIPKLAQAIYEETTFDRSPVLADALEEAGCAADDILSHLRSPGPHVRGCWAIDVILGKKD